MKAKRWPANAEWARRETERAAEEADRCLREARRNLGQNDLVAELAIADARIYLSDIRRWMVEAKVGRDEEAADLVDGERNAREHTTENEDPACERCFDLASGQGECGRLGRSYG